MNRRLFVTLLGVLGFTSLATTAPLVAQNSNGSAPAQQSAGAGANVVYKVGGDVSTPILVHSVEPQYPEKDGAANVAGTIQVSIWVDKNGNPTHVHVTRGLGMGPDEKAIEAVRQYRYKPAMKDGKPVMVELNVDVKFQKPAN